MLCPRCQTSFCLQRLHSLTPTCTPPCVARWPDIWGEGGGNAPMSLSGSVLRCKLFDLIPVAAAGYWIGANLDRPLLKERRSQYACPTHKLLLTDECSSLPYLYISPGGGGGEDVCSHVPPPPLPNAVAHQGKLSTIAEHQHVHS